MKGGLLNLVLVARRVGMPSKSFSSYHSWFSMSALYPAIS